jgi:porphobilinogen synthase
MALIPRPRRLRQHTWIRNLIRETALQPDDFIYPVFVVSEQSEAGEVATMPSVRRQTMDEVLATAETCLALGIGVIALFPVIPHHLKTPDGKEALNDEGLIPKTVRALKKRFPELGVMTDVALDPYTTHGQDGIIDENGYVLNDETVAVLVQQALCEARAGVDIIAPSDMMDGRIGAIRKALDVSGHQNTILLSYAAKYASAFYGPFRDAVGSSMNLGQKGKETYQMDPGNQSEALLEVRLDLDEGADMVMVKPAMPYLDVIQQVKRKFARPTLAYQVSGEYAMIQFAAKSSALDLEKTMLESLLSIKRAGANAILTYFALDAARLLKEKV